MVTQAEKVFKWGMRNDEKGAKSGVFRAFP